jgi:dipeptidyl aminopeptidase/acylaminoacyl peptidase
MIPVQPGKGEAPRRLTGTTGGEGGVAWSPDGTRLVFSAKREGDEAEQLYLLDLRGGEARRLTTLTNGARGAKFSPDGRKLVFSSSDYPGALLESDNKRIAAERKARKWNARRRIGRSQRAAQSADQHRTRQGAGLRGPRRRWRGFFGRRVGAGWFGPRVRREY